MRLFALCLDRLIFLQKNDWCLVVSTLRFSPAWKPISPPLCYPFSILSLPLFPLFLSRSLALCRGTQRASTLFSPSPLRFLTINKCAISFSLWRLSFSLLSSSLVLLFIPFWNQQITHTRTRTHDTTRCNHLLIYHLVARKASFGLVKLPKDPFSSLIWDLSAYTLSFILICFDRCHFFVYV